MTSHPFITILFVIIGFLFNNLLIRIMEQYIHKPYKLPFIWIANTERNGWLSYLYFFPFIILVFTYIFLLSICSLICYGCLFAVFVEIIFNQTQHPILYASLLLVIDIIGVYLIAFSPLNKNI